VAIDLAEMLFTAAREHLVAAGKAKTTNCAEVKSAHISIAIATIWRDRTCAPQANKSEQACNCHDKARSKKPSRPMARKVHVRVHLGNSCSQRIRRAKRFPHKAQRQKKGDLPPAHLFNQTFHVIQITLYRRRRQQSACTQFRNARRKTCRR